jgi:hypothetical protein
MHSVDRYRPAQQNAQQLQQGDQREEDNCDGGVYFSPSRTPISADAGQHFK